MKKSFNDLFLRDVKPIGTWTTGAPVNIEIMALAGFDFIIIDSEHNCADNPDYINLIRTAESSGIIPIVRVPAGPVEEPIKKMLDAGASGVLVPNVSTPEQAQMAVNYAKFPPIGHRGACPYVRTNDYGKKYGTIDFFEKNNKETALILMMETREAVENFQEIIKVKGYDALYIGPVDLSISMGYNGDTNAKEVLEAMDYMERVATENHVRIGQFAFGPDHMKQLLKNDNVAYATNGGDFGVLLKAATAEMKSYRS